MVATRRQSAGGARAGSPARKPRAKSPARKPAARAKAPARRSPRRAPQPVEFEFGGPAGALATTVFLPIVVVALAVACDDDFCVGHSTLGAFRVPSNLVTAKAFGVVLGWLLFQAVLYVLLPGPRVAGAPLPGSTKRLDYVLNGHAAFWCSIVAVALLDHYRLIDISKLYDDFVPLAVASCVLSLLLSIALYVASFRPAKPLLAKPGNTGIRVYDFFMGRELNPRIYNFDLKYFCELRPGLIGWVCLNLGALAKQQQVSTSMLLVNIFQLQYVWDALYFERSILTTMDITTDGFGFMLAFGDLSWVPFTYSLQARYLASYDSQLSTLSLVLITLLHGVGYVVFRGANSQKDKFRRDPQTAIDKGTTYLQTKRGTKLITSGFWGAARKVNYTGDWLMGLSWCLLCGFGSPIPYFYATYFLVLLIHRALRDDHACAEKYGADWPRYKAQVPCMFVPGVV